jgi:glycine cleavage system regulatory protein
MTVATVAGVNEGHSPYNHGMAISFVLTVIADDRPGIVEKLADTILAAGANWEESRMARLSGKFAGLLRVSVDEARAEALAERFAVLNGPDLTIVTSRTSAPSPRTFQSLHLELVGNDRPGIVRDVSRVLAQQQVNIEELETDVESAPMSGEVLFRAHAHLRVPSTVTVDVLRQQLEALAGELMVDVEFEE